jgi:hypothetical protein
MDNQNNSVLETNFRSLVKNFRNVIKLVNLLEKSDKTDIQNNVMNNCKDEIKNLVSNFNLTSVLSNDMVKNKTSPSIPLSLYEEIKSVKDENYSLLEMAKKEYSKNILFSNNFVLSIIIDIFQPPTNQQALNEIQSSQPKSDLVVLIVALLAYLSENDGDGIFYDDLYGLIVSKD